jgi:hypothetical protein
MEGSAILDGWCFIYYNSGLNPDWIREVGEREK